MTVLDKYFDLAINSVLEGKDPQEALEAIANGELTSDLSVAIMQIKNDGSETFASAGITKLGKEGEKPHADTPFRIGSITKPFGAATIIHLAEKGAFGSEGIDTKISEKVDEWADVIEEKYSNNPEAKNFR